MAKQASGAVVVRQGDTMVLSTATHGQPPRRGLPARSRWTSRSACTPRARSPARSSSARAARARGHADRAHDRPPAAPAVPQELALRDAARRHPAVGRPRPPVRHPRDERRLRRADDLRHPAPDARRRGAHRQDRGQLRRQPARGGPRSRARATSTSSSPAPRRRSSWSRPGANEIPEAEILDALDIAHDAIKKLCAAQHELREKAGKAKVEIEAPQVDEDLYEQISRRVRRQGRRRPRRSRTSSSARTRPRPSRPRSSSSSRRRPDAEDYAERAPARRSRRSTSSRSTIIRERIAVHKMRPDGRDDDRDPRRSTIEAGLAAAHARLRRSSRAARRRRSASPPSAR